MTSSAALPEAARRSEGSRFLAHTGFAAGWLVLAIVNAGFISLRPLPAGGWSERLAHHYYDAGQLLGAGLVAAGGHALFRRLAPKRWYLDVAALLMVALALAHFTLQLDAASLVEGIPRFAGHRNLWTLAVLVGCAAIIPAASLAGTLLRRTRFWFGGVTLAAAMGVANHLVLRGDYRGAHLFIAWAAATIAGSAIGTRHWWLTEDASSSFTRRRLTPAVAVLLVLAALLAMAHRPKMSVLGSVLRVEGAVVMPLVARLHMKAKVSKARIPPGQEPWFESRAGLPPVAPGSPVAPPNPVVLMITLDAFRSHLLTDEAYRERLPNLFALADASVHFTAARSTGSSTRNALATMFRGKYLSQLRFKEAKDTRLTFRLDESVHFTELLSRSGIPTVTFVACGTLGNEYKILRGFDEQEILKPKGRDKKFATSKRVVSRLRKRLLEHDEGPLFIYTHWLDAHAPYNLGGHEGPPFDRYLAEVELLDASVGRLVRSLKKSGLWERAVLIVSADHGESFGQHDTFQHSTTVYEELVRVPLIIRVPGVTPRKVGTPVSLIDIGPTVLDLFQMDTPGSFMGQSLVPLLRGEKPDLSRPILTETKNLHAIVSGGRKTIFDDETDALEIYDLEKDPGETMNLADALGGEASTSLATLLAFLDVHRRPRR